MEGGAAMATRSHDHDNDELDGLERRIRRRSRP
jgi:hypothetical protein